MLKDTHYNFTITKLVLYEHLIFVTVEIPSLVIEGASLFMRSSLQCLHTRILRVTMDANSPGVNG